MPGYTVARGGRHLPTIARPVSALSFRKPGELAAPLPAFEPACSRDDNQHLASPQLETVWSVLETPGDAARLLIGVLVCLRLVVNLFTPAQGRDPYRRWFYLGLFVVPLAPIAAIATW